MQNEKFEIPSSQEHQMATVQHPKPFPSSQDLSPEQTLNMADNNGAPASSSTNPPPDHRIVPARLAFGADLLKNGVTIMVRNCLLDGKPIQVALYED
jgi:hypothetical protein